ncbi:biotin-independent malonate decarboxylase subunit gamma [Vibrio sp. PP-XX7]
MSNRGLTWLTALAQHGQAVEGFTPSVKVSDGHIGTYAARFIAVVPNAENPFPRAQHGEYGLLEGWNIAKAITDVINRDQNASERNGHCRHHRCSLPGLWAP